MAEPMTLAQARKALAGRNSVCCGLPLKMRVVKSVGRPDAIFADCPEAYMYTKRTYIDLATGKYIHGPAHEGIFLGQVGTK
jgi:hypothetical protein